MISILKIIINIRLIIRKINRLVEEGGEVRMDGLFNLEIGRFKCTNFTHTLYYLFRNTYYSVKNVNSNTIYKHLIKIDILDKYLSSNLIKYLKK